MKKFLLALALVALVMTAFGYPKHGEVGVPTGGQLGYDGSDWRPQKSDAYGNSGTVPGFVYLAPGSATFQVGPHTPTRIYLPAGTYGLWANSFGGVTLMDHYSNLATGTLYRGVPIASGGGAPFDALNGTTTPSIAFIGNGATTTVTISTW